MAALAFLMDGALAFLPLTHGGMWFDDVGACSTLDFALRVFVPSVDMGEWHLRERSTSRGEGEGRFPRGVCGMRRGGWWLRRVSSRF